MNAPPLRGRAASRRHAALVAALAVMVLAVACASLPEQVEREPAVAFAEPESTWLGRYFADGMAEHPGENGFALLASGRQALLTRLAVIEVAEKSIDAQYFIWHGDDSGRLVMDALLRAAARGVRVRLLIDDAHAQGQDLAWKTIDAEPNIEVRIFNPFANRGSALSRGPEMIGRLGRLQHRMHNKLLAVDGQVGIVGGRNIGDEYFGVDAGFNFHDLDVLASGPVVGDLLEGFDAYWNSEWAYPISVLRSEKKDPERSAELRVRFARDVAALDDFPYPTAFRGDEVRAQLDGLQDRFIWASARAVFDVPTKVSGDESSELVEALRDLVLGADEEVLISSPYFSPSEASLETPDTALQRGVVHRLLTNSAASNNIVPAHSVYKKYRKRVLASGVRIHELQAEPALRRDYLAPRAAGSRVGLHAKVVVVDRRDVFIGSYNFNKAGALLSTETALIVSSPVLAEEIAAIIEDAMRPENSWQVVLDTPGKPGKPKSGSLAWIGVRDGREVRLTGEPDTGFFRTLSIGFYSLLPLKERI
ncbi:MAG TPA: phospholipase D family protein [Chondromyces sp.]|nr:phospholipase D family protein [Chondromyces sp.]